MPGPWVVKASGGEGNWHYSVVHDGDYDDLERTLENVTLMAAAPELLAACELMLKQVPTLADAFRFHEPHCLVLAREALKKAGVSS